MAMAGLWVSPRDSVVVKKSAPIVIGWVRKLISAGAYLRFLLYEATGSIFTPPGWDTSPFQVTSQHFVRSSPKQFAGSHLYTWMEGSTVSAMAGL